MCTYVFVPHNSKGRFIHDVMCMYVACWLFLLLIIYIYVIVHIQLRYYSWILRMSTLRLYKRHKHTGDTNIRTFQNLYMHIYTQNDNNNEENDDDDDYDVALLETRSLCIVNGFSRSWNRGWWHRHIAGHSSCGVRCEMDFICRGCLDLLMVFLLFFVQSTWLVFY